MAMIINYSLTVKIKENTRISTLTSSK